MNQDTVRRIIVDANTAQAAAANVHQATAAVGGLDKATASLAKTGLAYAAGYFGTSGIIHALKYSVEQAREAESAQRKLDFAFRGNTESLKRFADQMMRQKNVDDDAVVAQEALLAALRFTEPQIKQIISAAAELAVVMDGDLGQAVDVLYRSFGGQARQLGMIIPQVRELTSEQLKHGDAVKLVAELMDGQAANAMDTLDGKMKAAKISWDNAAQSLGEVLAPAIKWAADEIKGMAETWGDLIGGFQGAKADSIARLGQNVDETRSSLEQMASAWNNVRLNAMIRNEDVAGLTEMARNFRAMGSFDAANAVSAYALALNEEAAAIARVVAAERARSIVGGPGGSSDPAVAAEKMGALSGKYAELYDLMFNTQWSEGVMPPGFDAEGQIASPESYSALEAIRKKLYETREITDGLTVAERQAADVERYKRKVFADNLVVLGDTVGLLGQMNDAFLGSVVASKRLYQAQVAMSTAAAIMGALDDPGPFWLNLANAALAAGMGAAQMAVIERQKFGRGGDFVTNGPQMIIVGDNPGGRERVQVTPQSSPNYDGPSGGVTVIVNATYVDQDAVGRLAREVDRQLKRRLA